MGVIARSSLAMVAGLLGTGGPVAFGQESKAELRLGRGIEEVVVTARKRAEPLQNVPIAITAFSGADLEVRSVETVGDVARFTPNFTFDRGAHGSSGTLATSIYIRGVGQNDYLSTADPGVGIYIDEVYYGRTFGSVMDAVDLDRIEVLRGPQGTLFGRNTIGGAISLTSAMPTGEFGGYTQMEFGRFNERNVKASLDIPIVAEQLAAKLSVSQQTRDGYVKSSYDGKDYDDVDSFVGRGILRWTPSDSFRSTTIVDTSRREEIGTGYHLLAVDEEHDLIAFYSDPDACASCALGPLSSYIAPAGSDRIASFDHPIVIDSGFPTSAGNSEGFGASQTFAWDVSSAITLTSITGYRDMQTLVSYDDDGTPVALSAGAGRTRQHQFSQEVRVNGSSFAERLKWVAGLYYFDEGIRDFSEVRFAMENVDWAFNSYWESLIHNQSKAAYVDATLRLTDTWSVSGGIRYNRDEKDFTMLANLEPLAGFDWIEPPQSLDGTWNSTTPRISLEFKPNDDLLFYGSISKGFKSGGINSFLFTEEDLLRYDPEKNTAYELGMKSDWLDQRLRVNVAAFTSDYTGLQLRGVVDDGQLGCEVAFGCVRLINAAAAEITGAEIEMTTMPVTGLQLFLNAGYLNVKFTEIDPTLQSLGVIDYDRKIPHTPKWSASGGIEYSLPVGSAGSELAVRADVSFRTKTYTEIDNSEHIAIDRNTLVNGRISYTLADGTWQFALSGLNLTDKRYIVQGADYLEGVGMLVGSVSAPRTWTASVRYSFGK